MRMRQNWGGQANAYKKEIQRLQKLIDLEGTAFRGEIEQGKQREKDLQDENARLRQEVLNKEGHVEQLLVVDRKYQQMVHTTGWRIVSIPRNIMNAIFPVGTGRRNELRRIKLFIRAISGKHLLYLAEAFGKGGFSQVRRELSAFHYRCDSDYMAEYIVDGKSRTFKELDILTFQKNDTAPMVSIIIPVYNQFAYTYLCLSSILKNSGEDVSYEIIIADDVSTDDTVRIQNVAKNIKIVRNERNLRFLLNCQNAAKEARGKYILFLNNDTQVQENWLLPLVNLLESSDDIGMAGSKLLYPDGYLQEAGGILWKDGSAWNYGHRQNPEDSEFNYVHEVDYISGAAIMIRASLWKEIGGFDERFVPAYCEDSDLAFEVRKHGYKVMLQPESVVVHFEGISNGTDLTSGQKKYQVDNQKKFLEKWQATLEKENFENGEHVFLARDRGRTRKHVLVIDHYVPQYDKDAGSKTTYMYLKMLVGKGFQITFLGDNFYPHQPYTSVLQQMGILVLYGPKYAEHCREWLTENLQYFDLIYLNRPHITIKYIDLIKEHAKGKIIYYGHDLHFLRIQRQYELSGDKKLLEESNQWKEQELYIMRQTDMNYYPSEVECKEIHKIDETIPVKAITAYIYDQVQNTRYAPQEREGLLFVGGFGHGPNLDAVEWFLDKIYPKVYQKTKAPFYVVGSNAPETLAERKVEGMVFKGFVSEEELEQLYMSCRMAVVPLRYGAGVKGKVVEALHYGIPVVTTSVGAEGIEGLDGCVAVEDQEEAYIQTVISLYSDYAALEKMHDRSMEYVAKHYSLEGAWSVVAEDFQ